MRLEPVLLQKSANINEMLEFYMGRNTPERQGFIIENLKVEDDLVGEKENRIPRPVILESA
jgi:topoisomerase-4 subunit B